MSASPRAASRGVGASCSSRGARASEEELATARLDLDVSNGTQCVRSGGGGDLAVTDPTGSYLQVVVEKHRRHERPRLPAASSPRGGCGCRARGCRGGCRCGCGCGCGCGCRAGGAGEPGPHCTCGAAELLAAPEDDPGQPQKEQQISKGKTSWKIFGDGDSNHSFDHECGRCGAEPEVVEVYYFEQSYGAALAARGRREARVERAARRAGRRAARALHELLAAPRLLLRLPLALLLQLLRCALGVARAAVGGAVQAASDEVLKPALALAHNALLQPLLLAAANLARALRAALAPLAGAAGDCLAPAARLLAAARLADLHLHLAPPAPRDHPPARRHSITI